MTQKNTNNCDNFDKPYCPSRNKKLMQDLINTEPREGVTGLRLYFSISGEVADTFCKDCSDFVSNKP